MSRPIDKVTNPFFKKFLSWQGRCGAYAKKYGYDEKLKRMNKIKDEYFKMSEATVIYLK